MRENEDVKENVDRQFNKMCDWRTPEDEKRQVAKILAKPDYLEEMSDWQLKDAALYADDVDKDIFRYTLLNRDDASMNALAEGSWFTSKEVRREFILKMASKLVEYAEKDYSIDHDAYLLLREASSYFYEDPLKTSFVIDVASNLRETVYNYLGDILEKLAKRRDSSIVRLIDEETDDKKEKEEIRKIELLRSADKIVRMAPKYSLDFDAKKLIDNARMHLYGDETKRKSFTVDVASGLKHVIGEYLKIEPVSESEAFDKVLNKTVREGLVIYEDDEVKIIQF